MNLLMGGYRVQEREIKNESYMFDMNNEHLGSTFTKMRRLQEDLLCIG